MRSSKTHPLQIGTIIIPETGGRIGLTLCPGKKQPGALTGDWNRDLALDFQAIREWNPAVVISLIEDHEYEALQVQETAHHLPPGVLYLRMPIPDMSTPDSDWELNWQLHCPTLLTFLGNGAAIMVHCKGGLGRAGTVAARLLVEMGTLPEPAIQQVRDARPGAIQTRRQAAYVLALRC